MEKTTLIAESGTIVDKSITVKPDMDDDLRKRLMLLEQYDLGFLLLGLSPRRLLRDGRLFDNEQVLPLLLWFGQWDKHCRYWATQVMQEWLVFNPAEGDFEGVPDDKAVAFRDYFFEKFRDSAHRRVPPVRRLVDAVPGRAQRAVRVQWTWCGTRSCSPPSSTRTSAPRVWVGAEHVPPEVPEED